MHKKSIVLLNKAVADELAAVHQYMYFHFHCDRQLEWGGGAAPLSCPAQSADLPDATKDPVMPESLAAIANEMARTYITNDHWYRVPETWWHGVPDLGGAAGGQDIDDG